jgi:hypothetical protein
MSSKAKTNSMKRKKKDPARRRKITQAVIAIIIAAAMVIAIFEALFMNNTQPAPSPQISISSRLLL